MLRLYKFAKKLHEIPRNDVFGSEIIENWAKICKTVLKSCPQFITPP